MIVIFKYILDVFKTYFKHGLAMFKLKSATPFTWFTLIIIILSILYSLISLIDLNLFGSLLWLIVSVYGSYVMKKQIDDYIKTTESDK